MRGSGADGPPSVGTIKERSSRLSCALSRFVIFGNSLVVYFSCYFWYFAVLPSFLILSQRLKQIQVFGGNPTAKKLLDLLHFLTIVDIVWPLLDNVG